MLSLLSFPPYRDITGIFKNKARSFALLVITIKKTTVILIFFDINNKDMKLKQSQLNRIANRIADVRDVVKRINRKVYSPYKRQDMIDKVTTYDKTKNPNDDITLQESRMLYPQDEMGDSYDIEKKDGKKREVDINWTGHSQYRSELRDIDPDRVNLSIRDMMEEKPYYRERHKIKMIKPFGKAVVDLDGRRPTDVEADVITVMN
jgi:hypothetical protein